MPISLFLEKTVVVLTSFVADNEAAERPIPEDADNLYEFVNKGEEEENDEQALGPTDQPQSVPHTSHLATSKD